MGKTSPPSPLHRTVAFTIVIAMWKTPPAETAARLIVRLEQPIRNVWETGCNSEPTSAPYLCMHAPTFR